MKTRSHSRPGAFGSSTRKTTLKAVRLAFFARKSKVKGQKKKPSHNNVIEFLERQGYPSNLLNKLSSAL